MKKLETKFTSKGFEFTQVLRKGNMAIYEKQHSQSANPTYELIYINSHNGYEIAGNKIPPSEVYPSDSAWGTYGWTYTTLDEAKAKFKTKLEQVTKNEEEKKIRKAEKKKRNVKSDGIVLTCPITNQTRKAPLSYLEGKAKKLNTDITTIVKFYISRDGLKKLRKGEASHQEKEMLLKYNGKGE